MIAIQKEPEKLFVFDEMIADITTNNKFQVLIKDLFFRCRKLNTSLVFITQSFFLFQKKSDSILHIT